MTRGTEEDEGSPRSGTILIVEHDVLIRMVIADYLRECGYKVLEAASGDEAMLVLENSEIAIDIVMSDVEMLGSMDGFALATWVRRNRNDIDVLLTGSAGRVAQVAVDLCEPESIFAKPYEAQKIVDRIKQLLGRRSSRAAKER